MHTAVPQCLLIASWPHPQSFHGDLWSLCADPSRAGPSSDGDRGDSCIQLRELRHSESCDSIPLIYTSQCNPPAPPIHLSSALLWICQKASCGTAHDMQSASCKYSRFIGISLHTWLDPLASNAQPAILLPAHLIFLRRSRSSRSFVSS